MSRIEPWEHGRRIVEPVESRTRNRIDRREGRARPSRELSILRFRGNDAHWSQKFLSGQMRSRKTVRYCDVTRFLDHRPRFIVHGSGRVRPIVQAGRDRYIVHRPGRGRSIVLTAGFCGACTWIIHSKGCFFFVFSEIIAVHVPGRLMEDGVGMRRIGEDGLGRRWMRENRKWI